MVSMIFYNVKTKEVQTVYICLLYTSTCLLFRIYKFFGFAEEETSHFSCLYTSIYFLRRIYSYIALQKRNVLSNWRFLATNIFLLLLLFLLFSCFAPHHSIKPNWYYCGSNYTAECRKNVMQMIRPNTVSLKLLIFFSISDMHQKQ